MSDLLNVFVTVMVLSAATLTGALLVLAPAMWIGIRVNDWLDRRSR